MSFTNLEQKQSKSRFKTMTTCASLPKTKLVQSTSKLMRCRRSPVSMNTLRVKSKTNWRWPRLLHPVTWGRRQRPWSNRSCNKPKIPGNCSSKDLRTPSSLLRTELESLTLKTSALAVASKCLMMKTGSGIKLTTSAAKRRKPILRISPSALTPSNMNDS